VTVGGGGTIRYIDLANARATSIDSDRLEFDGSSVLGADGWTLIRSGRRGAWMLWLDGANAPVTSEFPAASELLHQPGAATVWSVGQYVGSAVPARAEEHTPDGQPTGRSVELPGYPSMIDEDGNFVLWTDGGVYITTQQGTTSRLTTGEVVAYGRSVAVARECDDTAVCALVAIDPRSGERRLLPDHGDAAAAGFLWNQSRRATVSPDGRHAAISLVRLEPIGDIDGVTVYDRLGLIDLDTGEVTPVSGEDEMYRTVAWADDSSLLFVMLDGRLTAYDLEADELFPVEPEGVRSMSWTMGFVLRSADGASSPAGSQSDGDLADAAGTAAP